jgi:hypothetical protein
MGEMQNLIWFWGWKSGLMGKFCLTCAVEFPILKINEYLLSADCKNLHNCATNGS